MDYSIHVAGKGHSEDYMVKADDADEAREAALRWFQEAHGMQSAKEYRINDSEGRLIAQGSVLY
jgi:predicted small metal-binding protein